MACQFVVDAPSADSRLDIFLAQRLSEFSRAHLQRVIEAGGVTVDGKPRKASFRLPPGSVVAVDEIQPPRETPTPEPIPLEILWEDEHLAAVNKRAGIVVHPSRGHFSGTLVAALAHHFESLSSVAGPVRPGIVHRLDRDTTGVIVVAKHDQAHEALARQFKDRTAEKEYLALVRGVPDLDRDVIRQPIGAHPTHREKMAIRAGHATSREAETFYEVLERFTRFALIRASPRTGRTHQIRLHLAHIGCPVLCDRLYGSRRELTRAEIWQQLRPDAPRPADGEQLLLARQALHASRLQIDHPMHGTRLKLFAELPPDLQATLNLMRELTAS